MGLGYLSEDKLYNMFSNKKYALCILTVSLSFKEELLMQILQSNLMDETVYGIGYRTYNTIVINQGSMPQTYL